MNRTRVQSLGFEICLDTIKFGHRVTSRWDQCLSFGEYVVVRGLLEASVPEAVDDAALRDAVPSHLGHMQNIEKTARWSD